MTIHGVVDEVDASSDEPTRPSQEAIAPRLVGGVIQVLPDQLEDEPIEDVLLRHGDLRQIEDIHDREEDLGAGDDDVDTSGIEAADALALLERQRLETFREQP